MSPNGGLLCPDGASTVSLLAICMATSLIAKGTCVSEKKPLINSPSCSSNSGASTNSHLNLQPSLQAIIGDQQETGQQV